MLRLAPIGVALVGVGGLLTLGFGIALAQHEGSGLSAAWMQAALGLWATSVTLVLYGGRMIRHTRSLWASWASGLLLTAILGLAVWQPTGSATPGYLPSAVVPLHVQRAVAHRFPQFAYLPSSLPHGLHYTSYDGVRGFEFSMWFGSRRGQTAALEYGVTVADCAAQASPIQSFTVNGVDVSWSGDFTNQRAWRCITQGRTSLIVSASRSIEGDANPGYPLNPKQRRHALELAQVVAYAEPIP